MKANLRSAKAVNEKEGNREKWDCKNESALEMSDEGSRDANIFRDCENVERRFFI